MLFRSKRQGAKSVTQTSSSIDATQLDPVSDPQTELQRAISEVAGEERENLGDTGSIEYSSDGHTAFITNPDGSQTKINSYVMGSDSTGYTVETDIDSSTLQLNEDDEIIGGERQTWFSRYNPSSQLSVDSADLESRKQAISTQTPITIDQYNNLGAGLNNPIGPNAELYTVDIPGSEPISTSLANSVDRKSTRLNSSHT